MRRLACWLVAGGLLLRCALAATPATAPTAVSADLGWAEALLQTGQPLLGPGAGDPDWHIPYAPPGPGSAPGPEEQALIDALRTHIGFARNGGWPQLPESRDLEAGDRDPAVALLRRRLRASGDYHAEMQADPWYFDAALDAAVRRFQARHGLAVTGVLEERTRAAANVPLEERIGRLAATIERWRWLPRERGPRYVWVNVGDTSLTVFEAQRALLGMRVIVGHPERPTPSLYGELRQVVFNPTWSVPRTIAVEDLLPRQQAEPSFLKSRGIRVLAGDPPRSVDPATVDWRRLGPDNFPYRLRQDAGPGNSLGRIKIGWDNPFDIYLHDTPARGLFALGRRTFSSGCVRLENAAGLATFLIAQDRPWDEAQTRERIEGGATRYVDLATRIPVYLVYLTTWVAADGAVHFRPDIYGWDERLSAALAAPPPPAGDPGSDTAAPADTPADLM